MSKPIKYRIFDMAKEFNQDAQVIIDFLNKRKIKVKNRYSGVEADAYELVKTQFGRRKPVEPAKPEPPKVEPKPEAKTQQQGKTQKPKVDAKPQQGKPQQKSQQQQPKVQPQQPKNQQQQPKVQQQQPKAQQQQPKVQQQQPKAQQQQPKVQQQQPKAQQQQPKVQQQQPKAQQQQPKVQPQQPKVEQQPKAQQQPQQRDNRGKQERPQENRQEQRRDRSQENRGDNRPRDNRGKQDRQQESRSAQATQDTRTERGDRDSRKNRGERQREDGGGKNNRNRNRTNNPANAKEAAKTQAAQSGDKRPPRPARKKNRPAPAPVHKAEIARPTHIKVGESIAVKDLASKMSCTATEVIKKLLFMGYGATINQEIDFDIAAMVAMEFGVTAEELPPEVDPTLIPEIEDDPATLKIRPPVVTVMGHVDHGKTSLLDVIRKSSVTATEAGGITQHIGAYQVICNDRKIVFLDTPGHEAFTAMRARGAQVTDIAILVVAADDGVMPQTIEAINHAKAANVPIIVAINKIDKPGANPMRVKQELLEHGLVSRDFGGNTTMVEVSAKKNLGINDLLEEILFEADVQEFKANPNREARGVIIEAQLDKGRGPVATVLVQNGTLRIGDSIVAGTTYGKVRAMMNERGDNLKKAGPSVPVEVLPRSTKNLRSQSPNTELSNAATR